MEAVEKVVKGNTTTFRGGTFRECVRAYSNDRMGYDRQYRQDVHKAVAERRASRKVEEK